MLACTYTDPLTDHKRSLLTPDTKTGKFSVEIPMLVIDSRLALTFASTHRYERQLNTDLAGQYGRQSMSTSTLAVGQGCSGNGPNLLGR
jgi:hypothetical protein